MKVREAYWTHQVLIPTLGVAGFISQFMYVFDSILLLPKGSILMLLQQYAADTPVGEYQMLTSQWGVKPLQGVGQSPR